MEFTGRAVGVVKDYGDSGKFKITFEVNEDAAIKEHYDSIKDLDKLSIKAVKYRKKRSLDANAYAWVLMSKIAAVLNTSKEAAGGWKGVGFEILLQRIQRWRAGHGESHQ